MNGKFSKKSIFIKRVIGFLIDSTVCMVLGILFYKAFLQDLYFDRVIWDNPIPSQLFISLAYFMLLEGVLKTTIGKKIVGLKIHYKRKNIILSTLVRTLSRLIPFEPISYFLDENGNTWHDKLSCTEVLKISR